METPDEIYLIDMWRIVVREWRWFGATAVVVLLATFGYLHASRSQWEATSWVQIGQVGVAPPGQDVKIEPFQRVLERLETPGFQDDVLKSVGVPLDAAEGALFRRSMKLEPLPYASIIKVHVRAYSSQDAAQLASAVVTVLHALHEEIGEAPKQLAQARLEEIDANLRDAKADRDRLARDLDRAKGDTAQVDSLVLAAKNNEIRNLEQVRSDLAIRLTRNYSYPTAMAWPVSAPEGRVFPNAMLTWGIGALAAVFFASLVAVGRNALRRAATARNAAVRTA
ncbi:MAG TPA: Wzz/FepE/Etk N-terminal domain-containing protein [Luteibacter sp.]|nr:Wzz/FepE/Etk N-terminal domain-containing protein [Luteibacter sp.]